MSKTDNIESNDFDRHYTGVFNILDEQISGELIHNEKNGMIIVNVIKRLDIQVPFGKSYAPIPIITGKLSSGACVTLFNNQCTINHTQFMSFQKINFVAEYLIWSKSYKSDSLYNKMSCVLQNAYQWSGFSAFEQIDGGIKFKNNLDRKEYKWFGAKIIFGLHVINVPLYPPCEEETKIIQRLVVEIETEEKQDAKEFIEIRNKVLSFISFAIKNNINIEQQILYDYDDFYNTEDKLIYHEHRLISSEPRLNKVATRQWDYNFFLSEIPEDKDMHDVIWRLEPVFSLYLSLFKYKDMPKEMVFLNMVQALETFHSRFFYDDKKDKYIKSVEQRFSDNEKYKKLLINDTQSDQNCNHIILVSRLNDLLIGRDVGLFNEYFYQEEYAQIIADTRHYYTHYNKKKESKALKGDDLIEAIHILRILLEYHVCLVLGIDTHNKVAQELERFNSWKQLRKHQSTLMQLEA